MDPERLQALLEAVRAERVPIAEALQQLRELPFRTLEFARVDTHRHLRTGFPEVVFGEGKTPEQIADILAELAKGGSTALATRVVDLDSARSGKQQAGAFFSIWSTVRPAFLASRIY